MRNYNVKNILFVKKKEIKLRKTIPLAFAWSLTRDAFPSAPEKG